MTIKRTIRGIRDRIPLGYLLGRASKGDGPVELIEASDFITQHGLEVPASSIFTMPPGTEGQILTHGPGGVDDFFWADRCAPVLAVPDGYQITDETCGTVFIGA